MKCEVIFMNVKHNESILLFISGILMIIAAILMKQIAMYGSALIFIIIGMSTWENENKKMSETEDNKEKELGDNKNE